MTVALTTVLDAGIAIRALRKHASIRIDDFALLAGVSKQFLSDVENGKETAQMGKVLGLLAGLGVKVSAELPPGSEPRFQEELAKARARREVP